METEDLTVRHPETGETMNHYEWNGWLWCENENDVFDFEEGDDIECPHCGDVFSSYE